MFLSWRWWTKTQLMYFNNRREATSPKRTMDKPQRTDPRQRPLLSLSLFLLFWILSPSTFTQTESSIIHSGICRCGQIHILPPCSKCLSSVYYLSSMTCSRHEQAGPQGNTKGGPLAMSTINMPSPT